MYNAYISGKADEMTSSIMYNCLIEGKKIETVPMSLIVQLGSVVDFNIPMLETVFEKIGTPYKYEQFAPRLERAKTWLNYCSPENVNKLRTLRNWDVYETFTQEEKTEIKLLHDYIQKGGYSLDELQTAIYDVPKKIFGTDLEKKQLQAIQGAFFKNVYRLLIDKEKGPRLYLFLYAIDPKDYLGLLDFSTPKTKEEMEKPKQEEAVMEENVPAVKNRGANDQPDVIDPVKEQISIDDFMRIDLRVCRIVKAQEIRKSHSCLKITLDDGIKERVIVSSIKNEYTTEELIGKKIIVIANLAPSRFAGVTSDGMLLAATNNSCGCQLIFVDDSVPEGTAVK